MSAASLLIAQADTITDSEATVLITAVTILMVVSGALAVWIARRTASGALGPNSWAGIRTKATRKSPRAWRAAHQAAERLLAGGGIAMIVSAILGVLGSIVFGNGDAERRVLIWSGLITVGGIVLMVLTIAAAIKGNRAAKDV